MGEAVAIAVSIGGGMKLSGAARAGALSVDFLEIAVDVDPAGDHFRSRTRLGLSPLGGDVSVQADLRAQQVRSVTVDGRRLDVDTVWDGTQLALDHLPPHGIVSVDADFAYSDDRGLRRFVDADGDAYVCAVNYPDAASRSMCCIDLVELRAPTRWSVHTPQGWACRSNGAAVPSSTGRHEFGAVSVAASLAAMVAGPWVVTGQLAAGRDGAVVQLAAWQRRTRDRRAPQFPLDVMGQAIAAVGHLLATRYPYPKCDVVLVPDLPPLAFSPPGLVLISEAGFDQLAGADPGRVADLVAHEVSHAWIGGLVHPRSGQQWLIEALATWLGRRVAPVLARDGRAGPEGPALDTGYANDAARLDQVEETIGRRSFLDGLRAALHNCAGGYLHRRDLTACWSAASGRDLGEWAADR
jgi:aminopeptidase N